MPNDINFQFIQESIGKKSDNAFITDFKESINDNDDKEFIATIEGIHETVTGNYTEYKEDELRGSPSNLTGVHSWTRPYNNPVLTHHDQESGEPIGRVIEAKFSNSTLSGKPGIILKARITDEDAIEKIKDGRYQTVSVGGNVAHAECSICGTDWVTEGWCEHMPGREYEGQEMTLIMKDITFVEVSFVNVPADEYAHLIAYDTVESNKEDTAYDSEYSSTTAFKKDTFSENQGGTSNNMPGDNKNDYDLEERIKIKEDKIDLLERQLEDKEETLEKVKKENKDLNDRIEVLENDINNYQEEIQSLNEKNKSLKDEQVDFLVEKIIDKKKDMGRIPEKLSEDKEEELLEKLSDKSRNSLKDILEDLKYEEELKEEEYDGFNNETKKTSKQNSEENNVKIIEEDEDEDEDFDINEEIRNL